jgi:hypothetical protein
VARGKARARKGQVRIPVGKISGLKAGRYVLKVGGRRGAVFVIRRRWLGRSPAENTQFSIDLSPATGSTANPKSKRQNHDLLPESTGIGGNPEVFVPGV